MSNLIDVSRYVDLMDIECKIEIITPMFLGGADTTAELRPAPFKSLFRYWWRILQGNISVDELKKKEDEIFGGTEKKSNVLFFISDDIKSNNKDLLPISSKIKIKNKFFLKYNEYLGYGIKTKNYTRNYLEINQESKLLISCQKVNSLEFITIIYLLNEFGTIGYRSRNGWGSFSIKNFKNVLENNEPMKLTITPINDVFNNYKNINYPFSLAKDEKGLLAWKAKKYYKSYEQAMQFLCEKYYELRKELEKKERVVLGFIKNNERLPKQLRFSIKKIKTNEFYPIILHIPYFIDNIDYNIKIKQLEIWKKIHKYFDELKEENKEEKTFFERYELNERYIK